MLKRLIACAAAAAALVWTAGTGLAQTDLGPFPVSRVRETPEENLIKDARLTTTSYGFLKLTTNARSAGMGDAYSAVGNDISAIFYNPAGITQIETTRAASVGYSQWIVGTTMGTAAFTVKTRVATFGVSALFLTTEEFEERTSSNPGGTGRMARGADTAIGLTMAKQLTDKLSFGAQVRYIKEDLDLASFSTIDVNLGTVFFTGYRSTRLSMSLKNLGSDKEVVAQKARVPTVFFIGGAAEVYGNLGDPLSVTLAAEQAFYTDYVARYYFGSEVWVNNMLALRAGYKTRHDSEDWSFGAGFKHQIGGQRFNVDASFSHAKAFEEYPVRVTVGYGF